MVNYNIVQNKKLSYRKQITHQILHSRSSEMVPFNKPHIMSINNVTVLKHF